MNVSVGDRWENYIEHLLSEGRYGSASEVVREGLRLVEEREQKLTALRETLSASIERGGDLSGDEVMATVQESLKKWKPAPGEKSAA